MSRQFAVIGLGQFGRTVALELMERGHEVLGLDSDQQLVNQIAPQLTQALTVDATDENALAELSLDECEAVLVAIGEDIESSTLCTLHLKALNVKQIWVKALNPPHHKILAKLGADRIVHPEYEMGLRIAQSLNYPSVQDYISLGGEHYVVEVLVSEKLAGKTITDLDLGALDITLLVHKSGPTPQAEPSATDPLSKGDTLVLLGTIEKLQKFSKTI